MSLPYLSFVTARKSSGKCFVLFTAKVADIKSKSVEEMQVWKVFLMCLPLILRVTR
jgi:hypothetical protein